MSRATNGTWWRHASRSVQRPRDQRARGDGGHTVGRDLRRMWALLDLSPWRIAVAIGWGLLALGSGLGLAALAAWLIARAWEMPPVLDLSVAVVAVRALGISRGLCRYLERLATHDVALRAMTTARTTVYRTLARGSSGRPRIPGTGSASADGATSLRRGDLLVRIGSDIDDLGAVVVRVFVPIAVAMVLSSVAIGLLATISVGAAAILAVSLVVAGIVAPWLSGWAAREAERAVRFDRAEFTAQALTVLDHAPELRVAGKLDAALAAADRAGQRAVAAEDSAAARSAWAAAATPLSIGASVLGALLVGIAIYGPHGGDPGAMTPMALTVLVLLPLSAFEAVAPLPAAAQALTAARTALHRLSLLEGAESANPTERHPMAQRPFDQSTAPSANGRSASPRDPWPANPSSRAEASASGNGGSRSVRDLVPGNPSGRAEDGARGNAHGGSARHRMPHPSDHVGAGANIQDRRVQDLLPGNPSGAVEDGARGDGGSSGSPRDSGRHPSDGLGGDENVGDGRARDLLPGLLPGRPEGRRIAVVGPSGAGKTTLLMAWAGLFDTPEPGVTFFAEDAHIFGTTVLENLRVARGDLTAEEAEKALCTVGLGEWVASLPDGADTDLVGGAAAVSGGQRRRILLARALISPARVLLLDEPTEHVEAEAGARLLCDLLDIDSGLVEPDRIVVVVTHQLPPEHRADLVLHVGASGQVTTEFSASVPLGERTDSATREIPLPSH